MFHTQVLRNDLGYSYQILILILTDSNMMMIYLYECVCGYVCVDMYIHNMCLLCMLNILLYRIYNIHILY